MVNFVLVVDANHERRLSYIERLRQLIPPVEGLTVSSCSNENFSAIWASGAWTPVSCVCDSDGVAIVFGEAIKGAGPGRLTAGQLRYLWAGSAMPDPLDGFHAAVVHDSEKGTIVGTDLLGIFPIYYFSSSEFTLIGSSPELFRYHPCFKAKFNPAGFVGILLTNGIFDGQTLFSGVRRLTPGHLLIRRPEGSAKEVLQFSLPVSSRYFDLKPSEQVEVLYQVLGESVSRHVTKGEKHGLMLSGGLDSRLLGGFLKQKDIDVIAMTEGLQTDNEMRYAIPVAHELGFKHVTFNLKYSDYPRFADLTARWQHLSAGFHQIFYWGFYPQLRKMTRKVVAGYFGTEILGGLFNLAIPKRGKPISFDAFFRFCNSFGFKPETLKELLKKEYFDDLVSETLRKIKEAFGNYSGLEFQRVWCFALHQYARSHVGNLVWVLSFGSWPILPFLDRRVLETAGGMPFESLLNRRTEKDLLIKRFPNLARLSLVQEIYDTTPLIPTPRQRGVQRIYGNEGIWRYRETRYLRHLLISGLKGERRYYARLWDFNSPEWKATRRSAEPYIELTSQFLNEDVARKLLPSPSSHVKANASGLKTLIGFALWQREHRNTTMNIQR